MIRSSKMFAALALLGTTALSVPALATATGFIATHRVNQSSQTQVAGTTLPIPITTAQASGIAAWDAGNRMFYTSSIQGAGAREWISTANIDGSNQQDFSTTLTGYSRFIPQHYAVSISNNTLFFAGQAFVGSTSSFGIGSVSLSAGGAATMLRTVSPSQTGGVWDLVADPVSGAVYYTGNDTRANGHIRRMDANGGNDILWATAAPYVTDLAISGSHIYVAELAGGNDRRVRRISLAGGPFETIVTAWPNLQRLDVQGNMLYGQMADGSVQALSASALNQAASGASTVFTMPGYVNTSFAAGFQTNGFDVLGDIGTGATVPGPALAGLFALAVAARAAARRYSAA